MVSSCDDLIGGFGTEWLESVAFISVDSKGLNKGGGANGTWPNMSFIHDPKRKMQKILFIAGPPVYA
jgi:hypothetical protein